MKICDHGQIEFGPACSECSEALLKIDEDGEMELKEPEPVNNFWTLIEKNY